jgi:hypothetical protein
MVSPCQCRGTSQYSHEHCLQRYFTYYPDRVCRVCSTRMEYVSTFERVLPCLFVPLLAGFIMTSSSTPAAKFMLMMGLLGLSCLFVMHVVFTKGVAVASLLIGSLILCIHRDTQVTFWTVGMFGLLALVQTLLHFLDPALLLVMMTCIFTVGYMTFFVMAMIFHLDTVAMSILAVEVFLVWYSFLKLRPAPGRNRIRNE